MVKRKSTPVKSPAKRQKQDTPRSSRQGRSLSTPENSSRRETPSTSSSRRKQETPKKKKRTGTILMNIGNKPFKLYKTTLKEIMRLQKDTNLIIPKLPFSRLIREIIMDISTTSHMIQVEALRALQESAELYLTYLFQDANKCAFHARRVTLKPTDIQLVLNIRGSNDPGVY